MKRTILRALWLAGLLLWFASPAAAQDADPCFGVTCGGNGQCFESNGLPMCACFQGYTLDSTGLNCIPIASAAPVQPAPVTPPPQPAQPAPWPQPTQPQQPAQPAPWPQQPSAPQGTDQQWYGQYQQHMVYEQWEELQYKEGRISSTRYALGGVVGTLFGFGLGHSFHKTYMEFGYFFTISESLSLALFIAGFSSYVLVENEEETIAAVFAVAGLGLLGAFRIWEMIDVWVRGHKRLVDPTEYPGPPPVTAVLLPVFTENGGGLALCGHF